MPVSGRNCAQDYQPPTHKMITEGARALDLWSDESLREEIDARRMAELVWKAMTAADEEAQSA